MKTITLPELGSIIESVVKEKENLAKVQGQQFIGITESDILEGVTKRLGDTWLLKSPSKLKFTRNDLNAVASNRFLRRTGMRILMFLAIVILGLANLYQFHVLPLMVYYGLLIVAAFAFMVYFTRKQVQARREFWKSIDGDGIESDK